MLAVVVYWCGGGHSGGGGGGDSYSCELGSIKVLPMELCVHCISYSSCSIHYCSQAYVGPRPQPSIT